MVENMTIMDDIERWARLLPPLPTRIPSKIEMTMDTYNKLLQIPQPQYDYNPNPSRFDAIPSFIVEDLEVPWIIYDQHGEEMKRAS